MIAFINANVVLKYNNAIFSGEFSGVLETKKQQFDPSLGLYGFL